MRRNVRGFMALFALVGCQEPPDGQTSTTPGPSASSSDATLRSWTVDGEGLQPDFESDRVWYASAARESAEIVATPTDANATVSLVLRTMDGLEIDRVGASGELAMTGGHQVVVEVTSADGTAYQEYVLTPLPSDFPELDVWSSDPGPGWYFLCNMDFSDLPPGEASYLMVIDSVGIPRWIRRAEGLNFDLRAAPGDRISWIEEDGENTRAQVLGDDGQVTEWRGVDGVTDAHEFTLLDNGNALLIVGRASLQDLSIYGGPAQFAVLDQAVQEIDPSGQVVFEWSTAGNVDFDHLPAVWKDWSLPAVESAHLNSVEVDPYDGNWVVSLRIPSQVRKIDRMTGEVLWTLGGPGSDFSMAGDERLHAWTGFAWQHSARITGPDRVLVYDNAADPVHGSVGASRMVEYQLDWVDMEAQVTDAWELADSGATAAAGSVQRLEDGHTLIGFGNLGFTTAGLAPDIVELDADHNPVFELRLPTGQWSYRAWKFDRDDTGWVIP